MNKALTKVLGTSAIAASLALAGTASAIPILTQFNINASGAFTANTGDVTTATTITSGAPNSVGFIQTDNTGLVAGQAVSLTSPTGVLVGNIFTKTWTTLFGTFVETLTVQSSIPTVGNRAVQATGTVVETVYTSGPVFDPTPVFYSASYTQNLGPGTQINASFNNSTIPTTVPEPATLALLGVGLFGLGLVRGCKRT